MSEKQRSWNVFRLNSATMKSKQKKNKKRPTRDAENCEASSLTCRKEQEMKYWLSTLIVSK